MPDKMKTFRRGSSGIYHEGKATQGGKSLTDLTFLLIRIRIHSSLDFKLRVIGLGFVSNLPPLAFDFAFESSPLAMVAGRNPRSFDPPANRQA